MAKGGPTDFSLKLLLLNGVRDAIECLIVSERWKVSEGIEAGTIYLDLDKNLPNNCFLNATG